MSTLHLVDPAARPIVTQIPAFDPGTQTVAEFRAFVLSLYAPPEPSALTGEEHRVPGRSGAPAVRVLVYRPAASTRPAPAILYFHGGGMLAGTPDMMDAANRKLADDTGAVVVAVNHRLAPETPFPGPVEDAYAALDWLFRSAEMLTVDPTRIIVLGHSAGGGLAAAVTLLARDRGEHRLAGQVLIYPMLDPRTGTTDAPVENSTTGEFMWTPAANRFGWSALRGSAEIAPERIGHFGPALAQTVGGLPMTFIAVGSLDLFVEEDAAYALRLSRAGCRSNFMSTPAGSTVSIRFRERCPSNSPPTSRQAFFAC